MTIWIYQESIDKSSPIWLDNLNAFLTNPVTMIPKIIHYCWFGKGKMPDQYSAYIEEWKQMHPGWTIIRWDETNAPMSIPYIQKAIEGSNWANISNYVRNYALRTQGGIYLDTDMKLVKPLDNLLSYNCFLGFESGGDGAAYYWVNNAILGAIPAHPFIIACEERLLLQFDGSEKSNLSSPHLVTNLLKDQYGLEKYGRQRLLDVMIFEKEVFYPIPFNKTYQLKQNNLTIPEETIAVHTWGRTWFNQEMMFDLIDELQCDVDKEKKAVEKITEELERTHIENNYLKELLSNYKSLEISLHTIFNEFVNKVDQLDNNNKKQQEVLEKELIRLHQEYEKSNSAIIRQQEIINHYKKAYENSSIWQIAKRRIFKSKHANQ